MKFSFAPLVVSLLAGCSPVQHREPFYGPSLGGLEANDPKDIADQITSVNAQLNGMEVEIATLDDQIAAAQRKIDAGSEEQLEYFQQQRSSLQRRHHILLTRRSSLLTLMNSLESRTTNPLQ